MVLGVPPLPRIFLVAAKYLNLLDNFNKAKLFYYTGLVRLYVRDGQLLLLIYKHVILVPLIINFNFV